MSFAASIMEDHAMTKPLLTDELWKRIEPLLPELPPHPQGGRPWVGNREALTGILFVLRTGIPWEYLPLELGCGCGMTCWRRLRVASSRRVGETAPIVAVTKFRQMRDSARRRKA